MIAETSYGVFASGGAKWYPRLYGANSFTPRVVPARQVIRTADAGNRRIQVVANRQVIAGTLKTLLYPTQAAYVMTAITTTGSPPALPSYSFQYFDSTRVQRYLGGVCSAMRISSNAQTDYVTLETDWVFQTLDGSFTTFAQPAQSNYPTENPYQHVNSKSNILLGGSAITLYKSIDINLANMLVGTWDESTNITACYYCGRDFNFTAVPQYVAATFRTDYEAQTPLTWIIEWSNAVPHSVTFTCEASGYIDSVGDDLPLDGPGYQTIANQIFFDKTAAVDFSVAVV